MAAPEKHETFLKTKTFGRTSFITLQVSFTVIVKIFLFYAQLTNYVSLNMLN